MGVPERRRRDSEGISFSSWNRRPLRFLIRCPSSTTSHRHWYLRKEGGSEGGGEGGRGRAVSSCVHHTQQSEGHGCERKRERERERGRERRSARQRVRPRARGYEKGAKHFPDPTHRPHEMLPIDRGHLVRSHHDRKQLARLPLPSHRHLLLPQHLSLRGRAVVQAHTRRGQPFSDLQDPVGQGGKRRHDEEGTIDALLAEEGEERDYLDGLAQALRGIGKGERSEEGREGTQELWIIERKSTSTL